MQRCLSLVVASVCAIAVAAPCVGAALTLESLRTYITKAGGRIESSKGNLLVTTMPSERGRVEIRVLNDVKKNRLGMYSYGFGNLSAAQDRAPLFEYLLRANSELGVGSFFVDKDDDIGYKVLLDTRDPLSYETFQIAYLAMVNAITEHRPEILKRVGSEDNGAKPVEESPEADSASRPTRDRRPVTRPRRAAPVA